MVNDFMILHRDADLVKRQYWQRVQDARNRYEARMHIYMRGVLNKQYKELASRIDQTNYRSDHLGDFVSKEPIDKAFRYLYITVGTAFAESVYRNFKGEKKGMLFKADEPIDDWYQLMQDYVTTRAGEKIVSITEQSKAFALKIIRDVINQSTDSGWGAEETAREIRKTLVREGQKINQWRALRIARTEIMTASNQGSYMGAESLNMPMQKYWIPTYDSRTRDTHAVMEQQNPKLMSEAFLVGGVWPAQIPGDPDLPPEEVINCRCAIAYGIKEL